MLCRLCLSLLLSVLCLCLTLNMSVFFRFYAIMYVLALSTFEHGEFCQSAGLSPTAWYVGMKIEAVKSLFSRLKD